MTTITEYRTQPLEKPLEPGEDVEVVLAHGMYLFGTVRHVSARAVLVREVSGNETWYARHKVQPFT